MKNKQSVIFKWLMLLFGLLAAGAFYSCSSRDTGQKAVAAQENRAFQAESAPDIAGDRTETSACAAMAGEGESEQSAESGNDMETAALSEPEVCYVYVCGEVFSPGVYIVSEGARIYEAVDLAGGFTQQAAESWLNLAEPVTDGMKLEIPSRAQVKDPSWLAQHPYGRTAGNGTVNGAGTRSAASPEAALVNINTASLEELMTLKGIGSSRAEDIIRYREEAGGFTKIEDIMKVPGIKNTAFQKIKENITV